MCFALHDFVRLKQFFVDKQASSTMMFTNICHDWTKFKKLSEIIFFCFTEMKLQTGMKSSWVQITQTHFMRHRREKKMKGRKNDKINWIRAHILIFIIVSAQTYLFHLPSNYTNVGTMSAQKNISELVKDSLSHEFAVFCCCT